MTTTLLVSGPPFTTATWDGVRRRLEAEGVRVSVLDLLDDLPDGASLPVLADRLARQVAGLAGRVVVVAHYTAVPVALAAAGLHAPEGLVLSNGPVAHLDPVGRALATLARIAPRAATTLLHPRIAVPWLASSAGLRRAVVNPYVMDRDTVVAIAEPNLEARRRRAATARLFRDLPNAVEHPPVIDLPVLLAWGDADHLHPPADADEALRWLPAAEVVSIPGGRLLHPVEHPWALADEIRSWLGRTGLRGATDA